MHVVLHPDRRNGPRELVEPGHELAPVHLPVQVADVDGSAALLTLLAGAGEEAGVHGHDGGLATADAQWVSCHALPVQSQGLLDRVEVRVIASCQREICCSVAAQMGYKYFPQGGTRGKIRVCHTPAPRSP